MRSFLFGCVVCDVIDGGVCRVHDGRRERSVVVAVDVFSGGKGDFIGRLTGIIIVCIERC